jgi:hypothetical protein
VAWHLVCQPKNLGGLGLHNLRLINNALRTRWIWLQRTNISKPWSGMDLHVGQSSAAVFHASVRIHVGDGASLLFWEDAWIQGLTVGAIALEVLRLVRPGLRRARTVHDGLLGIAGQPTLRASFRWTH